MNLDNFSSIKFFLCFLSFTNVISAESVQPAAVVETCTGRILDGLLSIDSRQSDELSKLTKISNKSTKLACLFP